jgi:hypothetical protein
MIYKIFDVNDEEKINAFIKKHKSRLGKDNMLPDPEGKTLRFLLEEEYDPKFIGIITIRSEWQKSYEDACKKIAICSWGLEMLKRLEPTEIVEERPLNSSMGGGRSMEKITAKRRIDEDKIELKKWETQREVLAELLSEKE